jgi:hypothetical protein
MAPSALFQQLNAIQKNFSLQPIVTPEDWAAFGVEYDTDVLNELNVALVPDSSLPIKKFFCGHRGCGKSTLLAQVAKQQQEQYFTIFFSISDTGDLVDLDHANILFAIGISLLEFAKDQNIPINPTIINSFYRWFNNIIQLEKDTSGGELALDLKFLKLKLQRESETREEVRKKFERTTNELISKLDEIAAAIEDAAQKPVLVIIDDLDKITKPAIALDIYSYNLKSLISPKFSIIYTLPIAFYRNMEIMGSLTSEMSDPVILMPVMKLAPKQQRRSLPPGYSSEAIKILQTAIERRLQSQLKLIDPNTVQQIVLTSGGVLREVMRIVHGCLEVGKKRAYRDPTLQDFSVDQSILDEAVKRLRLEFQAPIGEAEYQILVTTYKNNEPTDPSHDDFLRLLHRLCILEYRNDSLWYDVHPILEDLLRRQKLL